MMKQILPILMSTFVLIGACKKEDPFEYPDDPVSVEPTWITEADRTILEEEQWKVDRSSDKCDPNLDISNLGFYELSYSRGFASILLQPSDSLCEIEVNLSSNFSSTEITNHSWDELQFEFTYSEYSGHAGSEYWVTLYYKNLEMTIDIAPYIALYIPEETTDGLLKVTVEKGEPIFELSGKKFSPDFSATSGNMFTLEGDESQQYFGVRFVSGQTDLASYTTFQYVRISRFGLKDQ